MVHSTKALVRILVPLAMPLRGGKRLAVAGLQPATSPDAKLIAALRRAHRMVERERGLPLVTTAPESPYERMILRLAFLAPDIQRAIMKGGQPAGLKLADLLARKLPLGWDGQRALLGFE